MKSLVSDIPVGDSVRAGTEQKCSHTCFYHTGGHFVFRTFRIPDLSRPDLSSPDLLKLDLLKPDLSSPDVLQLYPKAPSPSIE